MRVSYNWLKDYIDIKINPEKLAETLTMAGLTVDAMHHIPGDTVLEVEITSNRPDWLSYIGVARELSAITGAKLKIPKINRARGPGAGDRGPRITVKIEDKRLCPRYTARIIRNVKVGESPAWLKAKLETKGLRPVNNIVDITNFCLFETGEPMHAFDLGKISGGVVMVRNAKRGEKITGIDSVERTLNEADLVISDDAKPIAIAGVMGALNTEVSYSTKDILLEAAYFDPVSIRRTSRRLALSTESSYRFERRVDISNIVKASDRASALIAELTGGKIEAIADMGRKTQSTKTVSFRYKKLNTVLGEEIPPVKATKILTSLGLKAKSFTKNDIKLETPAFRYDLNSEIDLIEEVARIYGYSKIPSTIPAILDQPVRMPESFVIENRIREILTGLGADEIITYSLLGRKMISDAGITDEGIIEVANPLTAEQEIMRPSLIPGLLNAIRWNMNRKTKDLKFFELGKIYIKESGNKFTEKRFLSFALTGEIVSWACSARRSGFFDLKGIVEALLSELGIGNISFKNAKGGSLSSSSCASIQIGPREIGVMGEASRSAANNFDIKDAVYICELSVDALIEHAALKKTFSGLPKYPSVFRDISLIVAKSTSNAELVEIMQEVASPMLKEAALIDQYKGKQIPEGKKSLTYRLEYQDPNKTLEERQISEVHAKILRALDEKFGAKLR